MRGPSRRAEGSFRPPMTARIGAALVLGAALLVAVLERLGARKLMLSPATMSFDERHGTWRHMFEAGGLPGHAPVALWAFGLAALWLVGLPYVYVACAGLPDRGAALARPIALLLVGWTTWWLVSLRLAVFGRAAIAAATGLAVLGAIVLAGSRRSQFAAWIRRQWRLILVEELIFWCLFGAGTLVRYLNPVLACPGRREADGSRISRRGDQVRSLSAVRPGSPEARSTTTTSASSSSLCSSRRPPSSPRSPTTSRCRPSSRCSRERRSVRRSRSSPRGRSGLRGRGRVYAAGLGMAMVAVLGNIGELRGIRRADPWPGAGRLVVLERISRHPSSAR